MRTLSSIFVRTALAYVQGGNVTEQLNRVGGGNTPWPYQNISQFLVNIVSLAIAVAGVGSFILLLYGGIRYITSAGDKLGTQHAREVITAAIVGLVIVVGSYAIATTLGKVLGFNPTNITIPAAPRGTGGGEGALACCAGNQDCEWAGTKAPSCVTVTCAGDWSCWRTHVGSNPCDEMPWSPYCPAAALQCASLTCT
ncbi:MAG: hypothetical protein Q8N84_04405 [bacterium]|nr:hypothetical protein [bacterium]